MLIGRYNFDFEHLCKTNIFKKEYESSVLIGCTNYDNEQNKCEYTEFIKDSNKRID